MEVTWLNSKCRYCCVPCTPWHCRQFCVFAYLNVVVLCVFVCVYVCGKADTETQGLCSDTMFLVVLGKVYHSDLRSQVPGWFVMFMWGCHHYMYLC